MTRGQIQQIVIAVLLVLFVLVWMTTRKVPVPKQAAPAVSPSSQESHTPPSGAWAPEEPLAPPVETELARDPFERPGLLTNTMQQREIARQAELAQREAQKGASTGAPAVALPALKLQGILWGTRRPQAIINRRILSIGDTIEEARIVSIRKDGVTMSFGGQTFELTLPERSLEAPASGLGGMPQRSQSY